MATKKDNIGGSTTSRILSRLVDSSMTIRIDRAGIEDAIFQHSALCQTFLPYRNPGDETVIWQQKQGNVSLAVQANHAANPNTGDYEFVGLPYGTKARLILAHINSEAIKSQSRVVDVEESMTAFIKKIGLGTDGRTIKEVKEQLRRLTSSIISISYFNGEESMQVNMQIVKAFNLWFPKDEKNKVMWTSKIVLSEDYFNSLTNHAIPLDERALAALSHNAMALDIYAWLAQRLHRIDPHQPVFIAWAVLKEQFGHGYDQMFKFKQVFRKTLLTVKSQYPNARIEEDPNKGLKLYHSPSPIPTKSLLIPDLFSQLKTGE
ncbi:MAG: replication initiator protein A [Saprospiraceae bacterium]|nr:replication initiator protein A [Saprospiraceae bacterium]